VTFWHNEEGGCYGGPHLSMSTLYAKQKVKDFEPQIFPLTAVYWKLDEAAFLDSKFRDAISNSLDKDGMFWPPIIWEEKTFLSYLVEGYKKHDPFIDLTNKLPYRVAIGNNRFYYAFNKGYSYIECVVAKTWRDRDIISAQTIMEYKKDY
jgi:hypothetical protein